MIANTTEHVKGAVMENALLLSVEQCAEMLGVGRTFVYALLAKGRLESLKLGKRRLIPREALEAFIKSERELQAAAAEEAQSDLS